MNGKIRIRNKEGVYFIDIKDVYFFEKDLRKVNIILKDRKITYYSSFKELLKEISSYNFLKCHKSYIVNLDKIYNINGNDIYFKDIKSIVPITAKAKNELFKLNEKE